MITPLTVPYCSSYRYSIIYDACLLVCHFWRTHLTHLPDADMRGTPETGGGSVVVELGDEDDAGFFHS